MKIIRPLFWTVLVVIIIGYWIHGNINGSGQNASAPTQQVHLSKAQKIQQEKDDADSLCMASIRDAAQLRQSVKFVHHSDQLDPVTQAPGGGFYMAWNITARNKLGMTMPYKAECVVVKGKLASLKISPR